MSSTVNQWCTSSANVEVSYHLWTIEHVSFQLGSPSLGDITTKLLQNAASKEEWFLSVQHHPHFPYGFYDVVLRVGTNVKQLPVKTCVSLLDSSGGKRQTSRKIAMLNHYQPFIFEKYFSLPQIKKDGKLYANDTLTLHVKLEKMVKRFNVSGQGVQTKTFSLDERFGSLLQSEKYTDVVINVNNREIKAHKFMLASQSTVFEAMLDSEMAEKQQNRITIVDVEEEVIEQMLLYVYTTKVPKLKSMAERLLIVADKYAMDGLKAMCEQALSDNLTTEKAKELLPLAEMYNASQLKECIKRLVDNGNLQVK